MTKEKLGKAVLVTTAHRGVFFGYLNGKPPAKESVTLARARNCLYWSADVGGFLGLASRGPSSSCKLGAWAEGVTLYDVTSVSDVSNEAAKAWESAK